jgi:hypothetical protein
MMTHSPQTTRILISNHLFFQQLQGISYFVYIIDNNLTVNQRTTQSFYSIQSCLENIRITQLQYASKRVLRILSSGQLLIFFFFSRTDGSNRYRKIRSPVSTRVALFIKTLFIFPRSAPSEKEKKKRFANKTNNDNVTYEELL